MKTGEGQARQFYHHLNEIAFSGPREKHLRDDFRQKVEAAAMSDTQLDILRDHASPTGAEFIKGKDGLWHHFHDAIKKRMMFLHMQDDAEVLEGLKQIAIFTQWNIANYSMVMGVDVTRDTVPYPARASDINTFSELLSYLRHSFLPAVKSHLADIQGMSLQELDAELDAKADALIGEGLVGIEIMRPIKQESWVFGTRSL